MSGGNRRKRAESWHPTALGLLLALGSFSIWGLWIYQDPLPPLSPRSFNGMAFPRRIPAKDRRPPVPQIDLKPHTGGRP